MDLSKLTHNQFPMIYERGRPIAVLVDLEVFQRMVDTLGRLQDLVDDEEESEWIMDIVTEVRAHRQAHPEEAMTFDSPEAVLAALETVDD